MLEGFRDRGFDNYFIDVQICFYQKNPLISTDLSRRLNIVVLCAAGCWYLVYPVKKGTRTLRYHLKLYLLELTL